MTPTQIEDSKIIAEFMELEFTDFKNLGLRYLVKEYWTPIEKLNYHTSWDWLMPVVEKICKYEFDDASIESHDTYDYSYLKTFGMLDEDGNFLVRFNRGFLHAEKILIDAVFKAVVEFINWYKTTK